MGVPAQGKSAIVGATRHPPKVTTVYNSQTLLDTYGNNGSWFVWLILQDWDFDGDLDILVDNQPGTGQSFVMINNGRSLFSTLEVVQP